MATWLATAAFGLEGIVKRELKGLGVDSSAENGGARFEGDFATGFLANLSLRCADRVLLIVKETKVFGFEDLFEATKSVPWADYLSKEASFPVTGNCARSQLMSVSDCQKIVKKAIVEKLKDTYRQSWFEESGPSYPIQFNIHENNLRISINSSGDALNRRGYRTWTGEAPIRETLAAAMILLAPNHLKLPIYDPCCGTATLLIEAAFLRANRAPGLKRNFLMEDWVNVPADDFNHIRQNAASLVDYKRIGKISGSDIDKSSLELAQKHLTQAGLESYIHLEKKDIHHLELPSLPQLIITNPPYGERLSDQKSAEDIYKALSRLLKTSPGNTLCAISSHPGFERFIGRRSQRKRRLYNGRLECEYHIYLPKV